MNRATKASKLPPWWCHLAATIFNLLVVLPSQAAPTASAGSDFTVGFDVPIMLDGTGSRDPDGKSLTYFWSQTSGAQLDMIGQDRGRALVLSAHSAGKFAFTLKVNNGTDSATATVNITVVQPSGRSLYVDNKLTSTTTTYSIANRDTSGSDGNGYPSLQAAADATQPGDRVYVRAGIYTHNYAAGSNLQPLVHVTKSGTVTAPIRFQNYNSEKVSLVGFGFSDADGDGDGNADGPAHSGVTEDVFWVDASYVEVIGFDISGAQRYGIFVSSGSYCYLAECIVHDCWFEDVQFENDLVSGTQQGVVLRWVEAFNSRRGSGCTLGHPNDANAPNPAGITTACAIVDSIFYKNGYLPSGERELPAPGDSQAGGNSDGFTVSKFIIGGGGTTNYGPGNFLVRCVAYHNCDDGFDMSWRDSLVEENCSTGNGPTGRQGFKVFTPTTGLVFRGNLAYFNFERGLDIRTSSGGSQTVIQNTCVANMGQGINGITPSDDVRNNLTAFNTLTDFAPAGNNVGNSNWARDAHNVPTQYSGDPLLVNATLGAPSVIGTIAIGAGANQRASYFLNLNFPAGATVAQKRQFLVTQLKTAFAPKAGSGVIDQGVLIGGYDCPTADDDPAAPMAKGAIGHHWLGKAPEIGAFEFDASAGRAPSPPANLRIVP